jgi:parallel beta-helix repeat protein
MQMRLVVCAALLAGAASGGTYYVSPDGSAENDGSSGRPWPSVEHALARVGGGHTIVLKPGFYRGPILIGKTASGTKESPTVLRAEQKWKAVVGGSPYHGVYTEGSDWVVIDGLEVFGARLDGIKIQGNDSTVRNCWVHNNVSMGIAIHGRKRWTIENNLIEFNGQHVQFQHGIYADGEDWIVRNNVVRHNAGYGIQLYPSCRNGRAENNLVYGHAIKGGIVLACPRGGGRNVLANNTIADNAFGIEIWNGNGEVVVNNILAGPSPFIGAQRSQELTLDYNLCRAPCTLPGEHNVVAEPGFLNARRGFYYLLKDSPAIGHGTPKNAPETDFWGRRRESGTAIDLGALAFSAALLDEPSRHTEADPRNAGWAYHFTKSVPDFWVLP